VSDPLDVDTLGPLHRVADKKLVPSPERRAAEPLLPREDNPKSVAATRDQKPRLDLLEHEADVRIAEALATGADKYGRRNYMEVETLMSTYGAAIRRHVGAWLAGEDDDPESGLGHIAHVGANVHVMLAAIANGTMRDDRGPAPRTSEQEERSERSNGGVS
jgi:hypothetical protein